MDGWFKAVNARTGELLWQFKMGSGIIGQPITYKGPDGKQYVAVLSGVGGWAGAIVVGRSRSDGSDGGARLRQRDGRPARSIRPRAARSTCSRCHDETCAAMPADVPVARRRAAVAAAPALATARPHATRHPGRVLRVCADPNNLPFSNASARGVREPDRRSSSRAICTPRSTTPGGRSAAASCATRSAPASCDVVLGVPSGVSSALLVTAPYYRSAYVFVSRQDRHLRLRSRSTIRCCSS